MAQTSRRITRTRKPNTASVRATVFNITREDHSTSRQIAFNDEFLSLASQLNATILLNTPYNVARLFELIEQSNMVRQCIEAYVTNTVMTGWEVTETTRGLKKDDGEEAELLSFLENANSEETLVAVMEKVIRDRESVGFSYLEIIRDVSERISLLRHAAALYTRMCAKDPTDVLVKYTVHRGRRVSTVSEYRRFRRFVQVVNGQQVWFKEFGDPRRMDYANGAFEGQPGFNPLRPATEIYHWKLPSTEPYGVPRWINQLPSIIGSREAEEVNMRYFQDNTVPPMMLLIGNGRLTAQSYTELTRALNEDKGSERQHKIMLLEAVGEGDSLDGKNSPIELKVEKLTDTRQSDGLFRSYDEANMAKVRSAFRLPPITVGLSQDVNFATAQTSALVAESQVFAPERAEHIDSPLNKLLINGARGLALRTVKLVSRTPSITSPEMVVKTMTALNVMGAITPRVAQEMANKMLQIEMDEYPARGTEGWEEWMDKPIALTRQSGTSPDGGTASKVGQGAKGNETKKVENTGNVAQTQPKNGQQ